MFSGSKGLTSSPYTGSKQGMGSFTRIRPTSRLSVFSLSSHLAKVADDAFVSSLCQHSTAFFPCLPKIAVATLSFPFFYKSSDFPLASSSLMIFRAMLWDLIGDGANVAKHERDHDLVNVCICNTCSHGRFSSYHNALQTDLNLLLKSRSHSITGHSVVNSAQKVGV